MQEAQRCQAHHPQPLAGRHSPVQSRGLARSEKEMSVTILSLAYQLPRPQKGCYSFPVLPIEEGMLGIYPIMHGMLVPRSKNGMVYTTLLYLAKDAG